LDLRPGLICDFGGSVDPNIDVFWTGEKIIAQGYPATRLTDVATEVCRDPCAAVRATTARGW
jgi:hypothetical protein